MDQLKRASVPLSSQGDAAYLERRGQVRQGFRGTVLPMRQRVGIKLARKCHVEPKFLHNIGVSPADQHLVLPWTKVGRPTARKFGRSGGCPKLVQLGHTGGCNITEPGHIPERRKRQKIPQGGKLKTGTSSWRDLRRERANRVLQFRLTAPVSQTKRRFQSSVEAVFARCHGHIIKPGQVEMPGWFSTRYIPSKPRRSEGRKCAVGRQIIDRKTSK